VRLIAAATAAIVIATGVIFAPNVAGQPTPRPVTQLHSVTIELTSVETYTPAPGSITTLANESGPTQQNALNALNAIAGATIFYAAWPYTLPASIAVGLFMFFVYPVFSAQPSDPAVLFSVFAQPLADVGKALFALVPQSKSAGTAESAPAVSQQTARTGPHHEGSLARSGRLADLTPVAHRSAKAKAAAAQPSGKKRSGTAGSARSTAKGIHS